MGSKMAIPVISSIDHVNIVVRELAPMVAFYRDVLGMRVTKEVHIEGSWVDTGAPLADLVTS